MESSCCFKAFLSCSRGSFKKETFSISTHFSLFVAHSAFSCQTIRLPLSFCTTEKCLSSEWRPRLALQYTWANDVIWTISRWYFSDSTTYWVVWYWLKKKAIRNFRPKIRYIFHVFAICLGKVGQSGLFDLVLCVVLVVSHVCGFDFRMKLYLSLTAQLGFAPRPEVRQSMPTVTTIGLLPQEMLVEIRRIQVTEKKWPKPTSSF